MSQLDPEQRARDEANESFRMRRVGAYAVLYLVWGSTYLAMRFAVETLPPFLLAGARFIVAGLVLYAIGLVRGEQAPTRRDWGRAAIVGIFLMIGGNASVLWAVQRVPSGTAALLVAMTPLWLVLFSRTRFTRRLVVGFVLGIGGVLILVGPAMLAGTARVDPLGVVVLMGASISWAIGSLVQRGGSRTSALLATGAEMLCGGAMLLVIGAALGEPWEISWAGVTAKSVGALVYLTIFGSLLGFTSYAWLLRHDEPARVATYAYVNPVIAVVIGALLGGEELTLRVVLAAAVIVGGVVAILSAKN